MNNTWVYADPHFWHTNIIRYADRPFKTVEEMNSALIKNHNNTVSKHDKVFILGDFALADKEKTANIIQQLQGTLILIMGNHDQRSYKWWLEAGFDQVSKYPIVVDTYTILSHEPIWIEIGGRYYNIHGHLHNYILDLNRYMNVCVETTDYKPINLDLIKI